VSVPSAAVPVAPGERRARLTGIAFMIAAIGALACMDAALKHLAGRYPPLEVSALRGAAALPFVLGWAWWSGFGQIFRARWGLHVLRGVLAVAMLTGFVLAVRDLSLADAYAIFFGAPLVITALAVPLLGERVDGKRWAAIAIGLAGVLAMLKPSGEGLVSLAALGALVAMVCYSLSAITMRVLGRTDSAVTMSVWFTAFLTVGAGALALPDWVPVETRDLPWLVVVGLAGAVGQHCMGEAFSRAPASVVAPFEYTALLWGVSLDLLLWDVLPRPDMLLGAIIVIGAGLYLIRRERMHLESEHP
jgi:drug/metabolite transporter (DMT)-like permease